MTATRKTKRVATPRASPARETRRQFIIEFKREAVRLAAVGDRSVRSVAQDLGIRPDMLYQWKRQATSRAGHDAKDVFTGNGTMMSQDEEIRRLRRENAVLREERDVLGKATAFFAKHAR